MPAGDFANGPAQSVQPQEAPRPRTEYSDEELRRLKEGPGGAATAPETVPQGTAAALRAVVSQCITNIATGLAPPDTHGAVTPTRLVMVTNVDIGVYNKATCGVISRVPLRNFFGAFGIPATETLFDPRVLYDRLSGRCLVTVESRDSTNTNQFLYIAGSTNNLCTLWNLRRFTLSRVNPAALFCKLLQGDFYDFPNAGYNSRRLVVTANNFRGAPFINSNVLSIDKLALYANGLVSGTCFNTGNRFSLTPPVVGDANLQMFILQRPSRLLKKCAQGRLHLVGPPLSEWSRPRCGCRPSWLSRRSGSRCCVAYRRSFEAQAGLRSP